MHLKGIAEGISTLDEKSKDHANTTEERNSPCVRCTRFVSNYAIVVRPAMCRLTHCIALIVDVEQVIRHSAGQVCSRNRVQSPVVQPGVVACQYSRGEQANVLETILLRALGADDARLGASRQCLVFLQ